MKNTADWAAIKATEETRTVKKAPLIVQYAINLRTSHSHEKKAICLWPWCEKAEKKTPRISFLIEFGFRRVTQPAFNHRNTSRLSACKV